MGATIKREKFFECMLVADRNEYRFHFRAWDAAGAERCLREMLEHNRVNACGELRVLDARGRILLASEYGAPLSSGATAPPST